MTATTILVGPSPAQPWLRVAGVIARASGALSRVVRGGGGGTLPGRVLLTLAPDALPRISAGFHTVLISGTNGKTTTTRLLAEAVGGAESVVSNTDGANLASGVAGAFLAAPATASTAVLEVDEVALGRILRDVAPHVVVLLNLSRDQLDRTAETREHMVRWSRALATSPGVRIVANCDDPLVVAAVLAARPDARAVRWVAVGQPYRDDSPLCPSCSAVWAAERTDWGCSVCGLARPDPSWLLVGDQMVTDGVGRPLQLRLPGRANAANAVMAAAAAALMGVPPDEALTGMRTITSVAGRYSVESVGGREVLMLLAKNPAGWLETLDQLPVGVPVVVAVNARPADGADVSWLWDVPFERLRGRTVVASGERAADVSVRLRYAEIPHRVAVDVRRAIESMSGPSCVVAGNYTAFVGARHDLVGPGDVPRGRR